METFHCPSCAARVFLPDLACTCGVELVFEPAGRRIVALADSEPCANRTDIGCNWRAEEDGLCIACATTRTVPDLAVDQNKALWARAEGAKRRVFTNLMRWGLFLDADPNPPPVFDLLAELTVEGSVPVTMGHESGEITINVAEADRVVREARRAAFDEPYRTMVGHFRHELGHFVFERLIEKDGFADAFRALFGDERPDYGEALQRYHAEGPSDGWAETFISAYATAHPHEDWAETFAHYLHLVDMVDSAAAMGLATPELSAEGADFDAYAAREPEPLLTVAAGIGVAVNHVNRAMGLDDLYPFVLTPAIREKLAFVQAWIGKAAR